MDNSIILTQMIELSLLIALGFFLYRIDILNLEFNQRLTRMILNVTIPALMLSSVLEQYERLDNRQLASIFAVGFGLYFVFPILAFIIVKLLRLPKQDQGLYAFMMSYGNVGFMGFPIMDALYGSTAVFYAAIINALFNLSTFTVGLWMMHYGTGEKAPFDPKSLLTPGVLGSVCAIALYFANVHFPAVITETFATVGGLTSPLAMIMIGATLGRMQVRDMFGDWHVYPFTIIKQFVLPIIAWYLLAYLIHDDFVLAITYVLFLMPVANISVLFATNYGGDEVLAARVVLITTMVSIISVPLFIALFM